GVIDSTGTGELQTAGNLTLNSVELTPGVGSSTTIATTGTLTLGTTPGKAPAPFIGGAIMLSAATITDDGAIAAPSGLVSLVASGGDLSLGSAASINVAGTVIQVLNQTAPSPGGSVQLSATSNLSTASGSLISVAGEQAAPAGSLSIVGGGDVTLAGALKGAAGATGTGGSFLL